SGWLWTWNLGINAESQKKEAAWEFVSWATSKDYQELVGEEYGWTRVPPGTRQSLYERPEYREASAAFADITAETMSRVNPTQPGVAPQPWTGIQFVGIPEFQDVGNQTSQEIADSLAGRQTVAE